jgi:hypothetical protein
VAYNASIGLRGAVDIRNQVSREACGYSFIPAGKGTSGVQIRGEIDVLAWFHLPIDLTENLKKRICCIEGETGRG